MYALIHYTGFYILIITLFLSGISCTDNLADNDDSDGQIDTCSLNGAIVYDSAGGPYTFTCNHVYINGSVTIAAGTQAIIKGYFDITQTGTLTIEQGARLLMNEGSYLRVNGGKLTINGTQSRPVQIKNADTGNYWGPVDPLYGGITIDSNANPQTSITWCVIDSATSGISCKKDGLSITHATISNAQHNGIVFYKSGPADSAHFTGNAFINNGSGKADYPLVIDAASLTRLAGDGVFANNSQQAVKVYGQGRGNLVTESGTWRKHPVPYVFTYSYAYLEDSSGVTITIEPGTRFLFQEDCYIVVGRGTLIAQGTATDSIFFENQVSGARWGFAGGLQFTQFSPANSVVRYCHISFAKENGIYLDTGPETVSKCTINDCERYGIYMYLSSSSVNVDTGSIAFGNNGIGEYIIVGK
jgi:hypothetical protein